MVWSEAVKVGRFWGMALALFMTPSLLWAQGGEEADDAAETGEATAGSEADDGSAATSQDQAGMGTEKGGEEVDDQPKYKEGDLRNTKTTAQKEQKERGEEDSFGHQGQFGIRAAFVGGYRVIFRYDNSPFCKEPDPNEEAKDQQKVCGHMGPPAIDVALSFAPLDSVEPFVFGRFGLDGEAETNTEDLVLVGAGLRFYAASESRFKFFIEPAVAVELESGGSDPRWNGDAFNDPNYDPEWKTDFLFHLGLGPQYDFAEAFGAYLALGMDVGVLRAIHSTLVFGGGVQIRVP